MTAELDYAYLAEFAKAESGRLTAINASFTEVATTKFPTHMSVGVAGRVRRVEGDPDPQMEIQIRTPNQVSDLRLSFQLSSEQDAVTYDGKVANVFAVNGPIVLESAGLVEVIIFINDEQVRRLAFEVLAQN